MEYAAFTNMFPKYATPTEFMKNMMLTSARNFGRRKSLDARTTEEAREIFKRFDTDPVFLRLLSKLVNFPFFTPVSIVLTGWSLSRSQ
jgi:hypothetical protein